MQRVDARTLLLGKRHRAFGKDHPLLGALSPHVRSWRKVSGLVERASLEKDEILRLRAQAQKEMGAKFDLAAFNDTLIKTGGVPLSVLPAAVDGYVQSARG